MEKDIINIVESTNLPRVLKEIIISRQDLINKKFYEKSNERKLLKWFLRNGKNIYKNLLDRDSYNRELVSWLSDYSSEEDFPKTSRIVLAIWDSKLIHRKLWENNKNSLLYKIWLLSIWNDLEFDLPPFFKFFNLRKSLIEKTLIYIFLIIFSKIINFVMLITKFNKYENYFKVQFNAINALIYRDLSLRIYKNKFGIMGVLLPELGIIFIFYILFKFFRNSDSDTFLIFIGIGYTYFNIFRAVIMNSSRALIQNENLFFYKEVKPIDTIISFSIVEGFLNFLVLFIIFLLSFIFQQYFQMSNYFMLFMGFFLILLLSCSFGIIVMILSKFFTFLPSFTPWLVRILFFTSAVLYPFSVLPQTVREYLFLNPVLQSIELSRKAFDNNYLLTNEISFILLLKISLLVLILSLTLYALTEKHLIIK